MIELAAFWALVTASLFVGGWRMYARKSAREWVLDLAGLVVQGTVIPLLQVVVVMAVWRWMVPVVEGVIAVPAWVGFLLSFVAVDYLYYWNHRALHGRALWPIHRVHHTVSAMDVLGTARNTLWTSLAIVYLWAHGTMVFLLDGAGAAGYLAGVTATVALDMWRHSAIGPRPGSALGLVLITPADHAWHHAAGARAGNFGANLSLWDRLHGTHLAIDRLPERIGAATEALPLWRQLVWPFARGER